MAADFVFFQYTDRAALEDNTKRAPVFCNKSKRICPIMGAYAAGRIPGTVTAS